MWSQRGWGNSLVLRDSVTYPNSRYQEWDRFVVHEILRSSDITHQLNKIIYSNSMEQFSIQPRFSNIPSVKFYLVYNYRLVVSKSHLSEHHRIFRITLKSNRGRMYGACYCILEFEHRGESEGPTNAVLSSYDMLNAAHHGNIVKSQWAKGNQLALSGGKSLYSI